MWLPRPPCRCVPPTHADPPPLSHPVRGPSPSGPRSGAGGGGWRAGRTRPRKKSSSGCIFRFPRHGFPFSIPHHRSIAAIIPAVAAVARRAAFRFDGGGAVALSAGRACPLKHPLSVPPPTTQGSRPRPHCYDKETVLHRAAHGGPPGLRVPCGLRPECDLGARAARRPGGRVDAHPQRLGLRRCQHAEPDSRRRRVHGAVAVHRRLADQRRTQRRAFVEGPVALLRPVPAELLFLPRLWLDDPAPALQRDRPAHVRQLDRVLGMGGRHPAGGPRG